MTFDIGEVLSRAWLITWKNKGLWIIGILFGFLVSLMMPLFILPTGLIEHEVNWIIVSISIVAAVALIPLFAIISGGSMIFTKSTWVLTYLRLTRNLKLQPLPEEAAS